MPQATRMPIGLRVRALLLSRVVTRIIAAPPLRLTERSIAEPSVVDVPTRHGAVRCFVTPPDADAPLASDGRRPPVTMNVHGGAFLIGAPRQDDRLVELVAGEVGSFVVNVDYSTAPGARFPVAEEQCFDVLAWIAESGDRMGWDADRIALMGGSAGANLALAALELARRQGAPAVAALALIVPLVDLTLPASSYRSPIPKPMVNSTLIRVVQGAYFGDELTCADPLASPARNPELAGAMPPVLLISAEHDSLTPQVAAFAEQLQAGGALVTGHVVAGQDHDYILNKRTPPSVMRETAGWITQHLVEHLS